MVFCLMSEKVVVRATIFVKDVKDVQEDVLKNLVVRFAEQNNLVVVEGNVHVDDCSMMESEYLEQIILGTKAGDYDVIVVREFSDISDNPCAVQAFIQQAMWNGCDVYSINEQCTGRHFAGAWE